MFGPGRVFATRFGQFRTSPTNLPTTGDVPYINTVEDRVRPILTIARDPATSPDLGPIDLVTCNLGLFDSASQRL